jgi:hypothetical protein
MSRHSLALLAGLCCDVCAVLYVLQGTSSSNMAIKLDVKALVKAAKEATATGGCCSNRCCAHDIHLYARCATAATPQPDVAPALVHTTVLLYTK